MRNAIDRYTINSFRFTARFYGPKMPLVDGSYPMPTPVLVK